MNLVLVAGVIESRKAFQAKAHAPCHGAHPPNDLMIVWRCVDQTASLDRHEIDEFGNSVGGKKTSNREHWYPAGKAVCSAPVTPR